MAGIDEFLDQVTVLPPGEWDPSIRIEPPKNVPSQVKIMLFLITYYHWLLVSEFVVFFFVIKAPLVNKCHTTAALHCFAICL